MSKVLERRNSFGGTTPTNSASASASASDSSRKDEKTVPHYLRASTGSCHDLCKYGHKNPFEEEQKLSGGRRKKLPAHLNNLTLHRSAILDRSKDVRNRNLSLAKSSMSLGEADRIAPKKTPANSKGFASSEHLVPRTASSAENKNVNTDGRKKHPMVAQKTPANPRYSNGVPKFDQKAIMPVKGSKLAEKTLQEKARTVEKATNVKQSSLKRPASFPTKVNFTKQVFVPSQASNHVVSSKDKNTLKGKLTSQPKTSTGERASNSSKTGRSPTRSSNANINEKEGLDMSRSSFSTEPELTASVEIQEDDVQGSCITGHNVELTLAALSSDATECVDKSRPAPEETSRSISEDDGVESNEKNEASAAEFPIKSAIALELQQSFDDQELKTLISKSNPEHKQAEQNVIDGRASMDEDSQTDDAALCRLSKQVTAAENADVYDSVLAESSSEIEADGVKVNTSVESLIAEDREEVGAHEDLQGPPELLALDEKHAEETEPCLDCASGNVAENAKADEIVEVRTNTSTCHGQSISETSSDGELLEEPKVVLIEPSDSTVQIDDLPSVNNDSTFEQDELKPRIVVQQLPEELSDDEFYEEFDFELSESDESDAEDDGATIYKNNDESSKADGQRPRRNSTLHPDDASSTPYKLKFKRGKIVELTPDSNGPRRLKFRRRAANEDADGEGQSARRIYKRNSCTNNGVPTNTDLESPGVKLRHQDTQEKKDAQGLFNNVIEETASKLVESRKSKVKALVGAFETVISLQDGKPTSSTPQAGNSPHSVHDDDEKTPEEEAA